MKASARPCDLFQQSDNLHNSRKFLVRPKQARSAYLSMNQSILMILKAGLILLQEKTVLPTLWGDCQQRNDLLVIYDTRECPRTVKLVNICYKDAL